MPFTGKRALTTGGGFVFDDEAMQRFRSFMGYNPKRS